MKLQHVSVMFVVIFIPIILVTSYFINLQVKTIKLETSYDEKLLNATYDAMTAFELNTANENLSSVSDSLRSIIDASTNIFFNTLCTNLGVSNASKSYVQPYIPAMLYTLYDGYYIYSPTNIPEICTDDFGRTIRTSDYGVKFVSKVNGVGIYEFNKDAIKYSDLTPTEPEGLKSGMNEWDVSYSTLSGQSLESEYGQILYRNNGNASGTSVTYSTSLHTWSGDRDRSTYYKRDYILKSYIPYSATYQASNIDITINYTLDNFMTIEGKVAGIYYTKSGYLIKNNLVSEILVDGTNILSSGAGGWTKYSEEILDEYIHDPANHEVKVIINEEYRQSNGIVSSTTSAISNRDGKVDVATGGSGSGTETRYWDDAQSAVEYYVDSYIFSRWVYENLSGIQYQNLKSTQYSVSDVQNTLMESIITNASSEKRLTELKKELLFDFNANDVKTRKPFEDVATNDPESEESVFYQHKRNVIKNSITYNLILSMLVYTEDSRTVEFNMPVLNESEWDRILNNVSIVSFMQGMKCGLKYYNSYAIVTSTNNEISVTDNEIYYVPRIIQEVNSGTGAQIISRLDDDEENYPDANFSSTGTYPPPKYETAHRVDCEKLILGATNNFYNGNWLGCHSFKSKEIKYDKILDTKGKYIYDHKVYTDYNCIVDSNYTVKNVIYKSGVTPLTNQTEDGNTDVLEYLLRNVTNSDASIDTALKDVLKYKLLAYRIAIAKERNNLYKTTAFSENYGYQIIYLGDKDTGTKKTGTEVTINQSSLKPIKEIKKIEVTIEGATLETAGVFTSEVKLKLNGTYAYSNPQTISTTSSTRRTLEFVQDFDGTSNINSINISASDTTFTVESIKIYYK